jgi:hypothetical protein
MYFESLSKRLKIRFVGVITYPELASQRETQQCSAAETKLLLAYYSVILQLAVPFLATLAKRAEAQIRNGASFCIQDRMKSREQGVNISLVR